MNKTVLIAFTLGSSLLPSALRAGLPACGVLPQSFVFKDSAKKENSVPVIDHYPT